jgi:hypothetical protein
MSKPASQTIRHWLCENVGRRALGAMTTADWHALMAAVQIVELWQFADEDPARELPNAFAACVRCMQASTQEFAFHAIAHVADWHTREEFWNLAGLPAITRRMVCAFEPGGPGRC